MEVKLQQQAPQEAQASKPNLTGIPTQMKLDFEQRSGLSFDDVRVHYNSDKPAQLQALAYTQGTQVYVGPGQERHLPHELGHVVQQKYGMVTPTGYIDGIPVNMDFYLENKAEKDRDHLLDYAKEYMTPRKKGAVAQMKIYTKRLPSPYSLNKYPTEQKQGLNSMEEYLLNKAQKHGGALKTSMYDTGSRRGFFEGLYDDKENILCKIPQGDTHCNFAVAIAIVVGNAGKATTDKIEVESMQKNNLKELKRQGEFIKKYAYSKIHGVDMIFNMIASDKKATTPVQGDNQSDLVCSLSDSDVDYILSQIQDTSQTATPVQGDNQPDLVCSLSDSDVDYILSQIQDTSQTATPVQGDNQPDLVCSLSDSDVDYIIKYVELEEKWATPPLNEIEEKFSGSLSKHTEAKILYSIILLGTKTGKKYNVYLYSERDACYYCAGIINDASNDDHIENIYFYWTFNPVKSPNKNWYDISGDTETQKECRKRSASDALPTPPDKRIGDETQNSRQGLLRE